MGERKRRRLDREGLVYGSALALALLGGVVAVTSGLGSTSESGDAASSRDAGVRARAEPSPARDERLAPDLPPVPDLSSEPPPAPARDEGSEDPRMAELGVEMRMLSHARDLLAKHPAEALGVLDRHRRLYPNGVLREEREVFAIEALLALEHVQEAERRYYEFRHDFPDSDFASRLEALMQRPPHPVGAVGR